jgi:hypothetical protein
MKKKIIYKLQIGKKKSEHKSFVPVIAKLVTFLVKDYERGKVTINKEITILE